MKVLHKLSELPNLSINEIKPIVYPFVRDKPN